MLRKFIAPLVLSTMLVATGAAADDLTSKPWDEIVAQAKQEGEVVWYNWFLQPKFRELMKGFEDEYGIKVTIPDGTNDGNFNKFLAEHNRKTGDIDVMSVPGDALAKFDPTAYFVGPLDILPDFANLRTEINNGDGQDHAVAFWGNQTGFAYDPTAVDEATLPQSFEEVTAWIKDHPMAFAFNDPQGGGAGKAFIQMAVRSTVSDAEIEAGNFDGAWAWFASVNGDYGYTASNADSLTRLNGGEFHLVPAWEDHLAGLQKKGEIDKRMQFYIPEFGMLGGGNAVGVPANAPHKAAGLVFVDWLTSAETQDMFAAEMGSSPVNASAKGVPGGVPPEQRAYSRDWLSAATTDDITRQFLEKVVLGQ
ncbi:ABC transporter substrate-binding protein [Martelella soudanensis]|uniref:ABC transporter substrate-binding protein n=1 Tax=unclassified Martelella TaxID=2629616 RepID=UPI0015DE1B88|nr:MULTISPECIES: extracellular solute-binding protein [unclassified Martelella]